MVKPILFDINFETIFRNCVDDFQSKTGYALERYDAERLMLQIFSGMVHTWGTKWHEAALQIFLEYMSGEQLDAYAESFLEARLASTPSATTMRITFESELEDFLELEKNIVFKGSNANGTFSFKMEEVEIVGAGNLTYDVDVEEFNEDGTNNGALSNGIEIGDLNVLSDSEGIYDDIIASVANVVETHDGHASENDEHLRKRLRYVLSGPGTAGTYDGYLWHALSAHVGVLDVGLLSPLWDIDLYVLPKDFTNVVLGDPDDRVVNLRIEDLAIADTDEGVLYWDVLDGGPGAVQFQLYLDAAKSIVVGATAPDEGDDIVINFVPAYSHLSGTVDLDSTGVSDNDALNTILTYARYAVTVDKLFNPDAGYSPVRPINDILNVYMCQKETFVISTCNIVIDDSNVNTVDRQAKLAIAMWRSELRINAGKHAVLDDLKGRLQAIDGVYTVEVEFDSTPGLEIIEIDSSQWLNCDQPDPAVSVKP